MVRQLTFSTSFWLDMASEIRYNILGHTRMREPSKVFVAAIHNFPTERGTLYPQNLKLIDFTMYTKGKKDVLS